MQPNEQQPYGQQPQQQPNQVYGYTGQPAYQSTGLPTITPPKPQPRHLLIPVFLAVIGLLLVGFIACAAYLVMTRKTPDKVFQTSLTNAFSTRNFTQQMKDGASSDTLYEDVSNVRAPRIDAQAHLSSGNLSGDLEGWGDLQNSYMKLKSNNAPGGSAVLNKWVQVRKNGVLPDNATSALADLYEPGAQFFGNYIIGNFSASVRQKLVAFAIQNHVYNYNLQQVKSGTLSKQPIFAYPVSINLAKLKQLNAMAAQTMGLKTSVIDRAFQNGDISRSGTMYINKNTGRLVIFTDATTGRGSLYTNFNTTNVIAEPKPDLQWADFQKLVGTGTLPSQIGQLQNQSKDVLRQSDIQSLQKHIEAYKAQRGYYPTFAQMNDNTWVSSNMPGLDLSVLQDPDGKSNSFAPKPTAKEYAYQVGSDTTYAGCDNVQQNSLCNDYKLSATLSDGTVYSKTNQ